MPLTLITGPAGSGKTGLVLDRFTQALERDPVLVVPTAADVQHYEAEILFRARVPFGGRIVTFGRLFELAARAGGAVVPEPLRPAQRRLVLAAAARSTRLTSLREPAARTGFPAALDRFVGELQAARIAPAEFSGRVAQAGGRRWRARYLAELGELYAAYCARRDSLGRADRHVLAEAAIAAASAEAGPWRGRVVLVHGFDDLSAQQLALVEALSRACDVTVSVVHEPGRTCLVARQALVQQLQAIGGDGFRHEELSPGDQGGPLHHLERGFLTAEPRRAPSDGQVVLLQSAGARSQVELVAAEVADLLRSGAARPDEIGLIARAPEAIADLVDQVFGDWGIPAAVHADVPLGSTAAGAALLRVARAALGTGSASDLIAYLRFPGRAARDRVDGLERSVRFDELETADAAAGRFEAAGGRDVWELAALRAARDRGGVALLEELARLARDVFEYPLKRTAPVLDEDGRVHQLAAEEAAGALEEAVEICSQEASLAPGPEATLALLEGLGVRRHRGSVAGRVELMSPYDARARQFPYTFVLSLEEGAFPRHRAEDPFLIEAERQLAGLPPRAEQRDEERYLFYVCLTRPTRRLYLSYRACDEDGAELVRSFFVDEVLELLSEGEPATRAKGLADTVFRADRAPSERELARALAVGRELAPPPALGVAPGLAARLGGQLGHAQARADFLPGSLTVEAVRSELAARDTFGASSLEEYATCPFRYFVGHELGPRELGPKPEPMTRGSLAHAVLERTYSDRYEGSRPTERDAESAVAHARAILAELAPEYGLQPSTPRKRAGYRRTESDIVRFIRWDAAHPLGERVFALEAAFGAGEEEGEKPALQLDGFALHGKIDRVDVLADGTALVRDYKTGAGISSLKDIGERRKLQLQLYLIAVERLWGLEPGGGIYHALGSQDPAKKPRGVLPGPPEAAPFDPSLLTSTDFTADGDAFRELLDKAHSDGSAIAARIQQGVLARDPIGGSCPRYCDFHTICRRERGQKNPSEDEPLREEESDA
jgi:RecB family exonuclease